MADGKTHDLINYSSLALITGSYILLRANSSFYISLTWFSLFCLSYLIGTLWISPDLDLDKVITKKRWGALGWLWRPYAKRFKHRALSHTWLLGPLTRLAYVALLLFILSYPILWLLSYWGLPIHAIGKTSFWLQVGSAILFGYYSSQWLHLIADGIPLNHDLKVLKQRRNAKK